MKIAGSSLFYLKTEDQHTLYTFNPTGTHPTVAPDSVRPHSIRDPMASDPIASDHTPPPFFLLQPGDWIHRENPLKSIKGKPMTPPFPDHSHRVQDKQKLQLQASENKTKQRKQTKTKQRPNKDQTPPVNKRIKSQETSILNPFPSHAAHVQPSVVLWSEHPQRCFLI